VTYLGVVYQHKTTHREGAALPQKGIGETSMKTQGSGYSDVLIGLQYGDEGKAKIVDMLAPHYDIIARFNGGANAGHTIETDQGKYTLQQVPSAVSNPNARLYIGSGCIINPAKLAKEISTLESSGMSVCDRLSVSPYASVIQPHHILLDRLSGGAIGTTYNGIGPAYSDRALRLAGDRLLNIRCADIASDLAGAINTVARNLEYTIQKFSREELQEIATAYTSSSETFDLDTLRKRLLEEFSSAASPLAQFVPKDPRFLCLEVEKGARVLFEGAQSVMLDVARGTTPYVTSSSTVAGAAYSGGDLPPRYHRKTIGVAKLLMSRVGRGPFVSEFGGNESEEYCLADTGLRHTRQYEERTYKPLEMLQSSSDFDRGVALRMLAGEYGSNTSRPRRIGALDLVQLTLASRDNGVDELYLTKADILRYFAKTPEQSMPVVKAYRHGVSNETMHHPVATAAFSSIHGQRELFPAFSDDISNVREIGKLPAELKELLRLIEQETGAQVVAVGTGPQRSAMAMR
jgi:adenylosuccinate synthase